MKKSLVALLCFLLLGLWACGQPPSEEATTNNIITPEEITHMTEQTENDIEDTTVATTHQINEADPFFHVLQAYASLLQDPERARALDNMNEEQRRQALAQGFEMLPAENAFLSWWNYLSDQHEKNYAFYDMDGSGTMALLFWGGGLIDVYVIQNDVAVQQRSFPRGTESGSDTWLLETGVIISNNDINNSRSFYRFENGALKLQAILTSRTGIGYIYIQADGSETSITWEEHVQLMEEYGVWEARAQLNWQPLAAFGR